MNRTKAGANSIEDYLIETSQLFRLLEIPREDFDYVINNSKFNLSVLSQAISEVALLSDDCKQPFLSFLESKEFYPLTRNLENLRVLICTPQLESLEYSRNIHLVVANNPKYLYFEISNELATRRLQKAFPNKIDKSALISDSANIAQQSVIIEKNVTIESNVTIYERVVLKRGCIVRAGAVIGSPGFEYKSNGKNILPVVHDGITLIGEAVEIGPSSIVGQGFYNRPTILGKQVKTDNLVSIAHGSLVGDRTLIAAGAVIAGSVRIGSDVWVGPGAIISNGLNLGANSFIALGSHVFKDVKEGDRVIGSPARSLPYRDK